MNDSQPQTPNFQDNRNLGHRLLAMVVFPLLLVAAAVGIYVAFGLASRHERQPAELLDEIRQGGRAARWQAAVDLARCLAQPSATTRNPEVRNGLRDLLKPDSVADASLRPFLLTALSRYANPADAAVFARHCAPAYDATTRFHAMHAMGAVPGREAAAAALGVLKTDSDHAIRSLAIGVLAACIDAGSATHQELGVVHDALSDPALEVRWNAAVLLGTHGDSRSTTVLATMLDEAQYARHTRVDAMQKRLAILRALQAATVLKDDSLRSRIAHLAANAEDAQVRTDAVRALAALARDNVTTRAR